MGLIVNQLVGTAKGKIGNFVYRRTKKIGNSYISMAPKKYRKTKKVGAINNRSKFSLLVKFSAAVNSSVFLKHAWKISRLEGKSSYTKIFKSNHYQTNLNYMKAGAHIVPKGLFLRISGMNTLNKTLSVKFEVQTQLLNTFKPPYFAVAMIHMYTPAKKPSSKEDKFNRFLIIEEEIPSFSFSDKNTNTFTFKKAGDILGILDDFENVSVYFTIICENNNEGKYDWTKGNCYILKGTENYNIDNERNKILTKEMKELPKTEIKPVFNVILR